MFDDSIDPSILAEFIDESMDSLETLPQLFIEMEKNPQDIEVINAIFRPVHSIKGNSAFFGMLKLKNLTHEMETTLDLCRKHELIPNKDIIDTLLKGLDEVIAILERIRNGSPEVENEKNFNDLVNEVKNSQTSTGTSNNDSLPNLDEIVSKLSQVIDSGVLEDKEEKELIVSSLDMLQKLYCPLLPAETSSDISSTGDIYEDISNWLNSNAQEDLEEDECIELTALLASLQDKMTKDEALEIYNKLIEDYQTFIGTVGLDSILKEIITEKVAALKEIQPLEQTATALEEEPALEELIPFESEIVLEEIKTENENSQEKPLKEKDNAEAKSNKSMRVPEDTIDEFLNFVGELVVVREMYDHLRLHFEEEGVRAELTTELRRYTENFRQVSGELERTCMNIRKQPIKLILQKIPRIVRDVAAVCNKKINVEISGDQISVDKSLIGALEAPLVHMTRNAADHGIETIDDRIASGKDEAGTISIDVSEDDEYLFIKISDNGKGLNFEALREKGVKMGLFQENDKPSEEEISQVIFMSGVSTAEKVTDISGRGVGMDVVKKYIEGAGGTVSIHSTLGESSTFSIQMKKSITTQIIEGLVLKQDNTHYVIPIKYVVESFPPEAESFCSVYDKIEHIKRYDLLLPVIRLNEVFQGTQDTKRTKDDGILIVVDYSGEKIALLVDEIVNIQQVVLKPLKGLHMNKDIFSGGALRGDGYISLILNIEHLVREKNITLSETEDIVV